MKRIVLSTLCFLITSVTLAQLNGTYTIGTTGDFPTISDAVDTMTVRGVSGPVIFNVDSASGPYTGGILIENIPGNSALNTITFNGNRAIVSFATNLNAWAVIALRSVEYVTIDNFQLRALGTSYAVGISLSDNANYNTISNNDIAISSIVTWTERSSGIAAAGYNSLNTTGVHANYCVIKNNSIHGVSATSGPYHGMHFRANTNGTGAIDNIVENNSVKGFYRNGLYFENQNGLRLSGNDISRPTRTNFIETSGINIQGTTNNVIIEKNTIHDLIAGTSSVNCFGIQAFWADADSGSENRVYNNLIYNFGPASSDEYGFRNHGSDGWFVSFNTIVFVNLTSTMGHAYGISQYNTTKNIRFLNNLIYIFKEGNGENYGFDFTTTSPGLICNHNSVYVSSSSTAPLFNDFVGKRGSSKYNTIENWQTQNPDSLGKMSVDADPEFIDLSTNNFTPTSGLVDNIGIPIGGITDDIYGSTRSITVPDAGAIEFEQPKNDAGVIAILGLEYNCPGPATVTAKVKNFGSDTLKQITLNWTVNTLAQLPTTQPTNIAPGETADIIVGSFTLNSTTSYDLVSWSSMPNNAVDPKEKNDTSFLFNKKAALLGGTYTVGTTGNYITFVEAVDDITERGICGPIVLDIDSASGPYNGIVNLGPVSGHNPTNNFKILGNGAIINATTTTFQGHIMQLTNISHSSIDRLDLRLAGLGTYTADGLILTEQSDYDTITNCSIDMSALTLTSSSSPSSGIHVTGYAGPDTLGNGGNHILLENNTIKGGLYGPWYGIRLRGRKVSLLKGIQLINNKVEDFYTSGIYLSNTDSTLVSQNDISRPATVGGIYIGVDLLDSTIHARIERNRLHTTNGSTASSQSSIGFRVNAAAPVGKENIIANNLFYNLIGNGNQHGIFCFDGSGLQVLNNTFSLDNANSSPVSSRITTGIIVYDRVDNLLAKNNIISITRGGNSTNYGIYIDSSTTAVISDYNSLHVNGSGTNFYGYYNHNTYSTFTAWQGANSAAYDQSSVSTIPLFANLSAGDLTPTNLVINGIGQVLPEVTDDFYGTVRSATAPDIGAIEFVYNHVNDSCSNATTISTGITVGSTFGSGIDNAPTCNTTNGSSGGVWYKFVGTGNYISASLCGSGFDTRIRVFSGSCSNLICEAGNDDSCATQSVAGWCSQQNTDYFILVHGNGAEGIYELEITEIPTSLPIVTFVNNNVFCDGDSVEITSSLALNYLWNDVSASTTQSIFIKDSAEYYVNIGMDTLGCERISAPVKAVVLPTPEIDLGLDTVYCIENTDSLILQAGLWDTYLWNTGDTSSTLALTSAGLGEGIHTIQVLVADSNGCVGQDEIIITVKECTIGFSESNNRETVTIYPNPGNGIFNIQPVTSWKEEVNIVVTDLHGKVIFQDKQASINANYKLDLSKHSKGIYFISLQSTNQRFNTKVVLK